MTQREKDQELLRRIEQTSSDRKQGLTDHDRDVIAGWVIALVILVVIAALAAGGGGFTDPGF